jgi:hypothetical protein
VSRIDSSNGSTVKAFSTVGLQVFKMPASAKNGKITGKKIQLTGTVIENETRRY